MNTYTKTIVAIAAVVAISAILVASTLASDAMACRHRGHSSHNSQSLAQGAVATGSNAKAQNVATQQLGDSNSAVTIGTQ
jgi:hypothetical protein